jgi:hypothetical protein
MLPEGGTALTANTHYAASMYQYPIHTQKSGLGVVVAVGTELVSSWDPTRQLNWQELNIIKIGLSISVGWRGR